MIFTAGFIAREIAAFDYGNLIKFIVSVCLVYASPYVAGKPPVMMDCGGVSVCGGWPALLTMNNRPIFELGNYQVLGRILYYVPYYSPVHPGRVLTTFAFISAVVEGLNGNGASYSSNSSLPEYKQNIGKALLKAALLLQIVVVSLFLLLAGTFHRRCAKAGVLNSNLRNALYTLYGSSIILTARTVYRIVEYFSVAELHIGPGFNPQSLNPVVRYEWFFYVFEASLMICNSVLINVRHPRRYLPSSTKIYLARDGVTEIRGPGYKDTRPFLITLVDPFDLMGLIQGRDKKTRFWDEDNSNNNGDESAASNNKAKNLGREGDVEAS